MFDRRPTERHLHAFRIAGGGWNAAPTQDRKISRKVSLWRVLQIFAKRLQDGRGMDWNLHCNKMTVKISLCAFIVGAAFHSPPAWM